MEQTDAMIAQMANSPIAYPLLLLQRGPAISARKNPASYPTIIRVPVTTVGSIGKVSSPEKLMPTGIIGTITTPIIKVCTVITS